MDKKLWLCVLVGALVGAAGVRGAHLISDRNSRELFGQRLRCRGLAEEYVKEHSTPHYTVVVDHVEFSRSRSSCIAATDEQIGDVRNLSISWDLTYKVVDLLTGETINTLRCSGQKDCAQRMQDREQAFQKAR
jgi:hypothetical protein